MRRASRPARHCFAPPGRSPGRRRRHDSCREIYAARGAPPLYSWPWPTSSAQHAAPLTFGVDDFVFNDYFRITRAGEITVIDKRKLYRDHLELSTLFRGWLCSFCNVNKIPLLDARTTAEYKLYQGRLYVNCTTFPSP